MCLLQQGKAVSSLLLGFSQRFATASSTAVPQSCKQRCKRTSL